MGYPRGEVEVDEAHASPDAVTVYRRSGCGFCASLQARLGRTTLPVVLVDIWADGQPGDDARAFVRSVANGNEVVPTVVVGGVAMVNPTMDGVVGMISRHAPHLVT